MTVESIHHVGIAVNRTLQYFALFRFPLQVHEIRQHCSLHCTEAEIRDYLEEQEYSGNVFSAHGYFCLLPEVEALLERRLKGKQKAVKDIIAARRVAKLIFQAPFVRYVGISGSLSKGFADAKSDYDFFIITEENRLWISRTLLHMLKKLSFLVGQQHKLCMNYFIDETALDLEEKNIYTATELNSLIPVCGLEMHGRLMDANAWVSRFLPNYVREPAEADSSRTTVFKRCSSWLFDTACPEKFNVFLMRLTDTKWRRKWAKQGYPAEDYDLAFKTRINISKNHRLNYQKRVLSALRLNES